MHQLYESPNTEAVILIDATNAFNSLNWQLLFHNICHICSSLYRQGASLFIDNETIMSLEGTTQGDPLAMAIYAVSIIPLIYRLEIPSIKQVWYTDDASACGKLSSVKD